MVKLSMRGRSMNYQLRAMLVQELQSIGEVGITNVVPWAVEIVIALSMCVDLDIRIAHFAINEVEEQRIKRTGGNFGGVLLQLLDESPKLEIVLPDDLDIENRTTSS